MTTNPNYRRWTDAELQFIRDHLGAMTVKQIAQKLNRSVFATKTKVYDLGLTVRGQRQTFLDGNHPAAIHRHPFFGPLLLPIYQPPLPRHAWTAFDQVRALLGYGVLDDDRLATVLGRTPAALVTQRYLFRWNKQKAALLRDRLERSDALRDTLDELRETGDPRVSADFTEVLCPRCYKRSTPRTSAGSCKPSSTVSTSN